jgi:uncharacterized repeat protein (TIGR01451 family)
LPRPGPLALSGRWLFVTGATLLLAGTALFAVGAARAVADTAACTVNKQQGKLCVAVSDTPDPVEYSGIDGSNTFLRYRTIVSNAGRSSSLSHVGLTEDLPAGTTLVRVTTSTGTCSGSVSCTFGSLKKGQSATVDVVVTAPAAGTPSPVSLTAIGAFDERFNDQTGGKQDTVVVGEQTGVSQGADQTFVPRGHSGRFGATSAAGSQRASTSIPNASEDVVASLDVEATDDPAFSCASGRVELSDGQTYVCRAGRFVNSVITDASTGALYSNAQDPPVYHLEWAGDLSFPFQNRNNFVVFNQVGTASVEAISARCNANASNQPCLRNINPLSDGGWSVDLVKAADNRMR